MSLGFTSYQVENDIAFANAMDRAARQSKNLTIPLTSIMKDFYKSRTAIFALKGPGQYPDLSPRYKPNKQRAVGFVYPILKLSGALEESVTSDSGKDNVTRIEPLSLEMGTTVPYANYHQQEGDFTNTGKMPLRKFLFIGPESVKFANSDISGFPERALNTLNVFVLRQMGKSIEEATGVKPTIKQQRPKL